MVRDDIQLIKLMWGESIARHCAPSQVSKLDFNMLLSGQSFVSDSFSELFYIGDSDIIDHAYR